MRQNRYIFGTFAALSAVLCARYGCAAVGFMSKYGEIQPVQNYSSNPFWTPDSPYNARFPTPIYATGADLNTAECNNMVESLVTSYCALNNECKNMKISDVRPKIMVQLSQLPGHNYATSCGGYIDSVFNNYQKKHGNMSTNIVTQTGVNSTKSTLDIQIQNPFAVKPNEYQKGVMERTNELHELQSMNATSTELNATEFPKTAADLSLSDTMALRSAGYEPYKDKSAYKTINIESEEEFLKRLQGNNRLEYCKRMPDNSTCKIDIDYKTFCGQPEEAEPTKYTIGRGATISWTPTRDKCTFIGWCTDSALTDCAKTQTIGPNETEAKTFYAKWKCEAGVNPVDTSCGSSKPPVINPSNCPDPHMDADCKCTGKFAHDPKNKNKCICADSTKSIENNCEPKVQNPSQQEADAEYAIFECRADTIPDAQTIGAISNPIAAFGCYTNQPPSVKKCFKNQYQNGHGLVNTAIESITGNVYPYGGFLTGYSPNTVKKFTLNQINEVRNALNNLTTADRKKYCYTKGYWMIFFMQKTTDNKWLSVDQPFILYDKSWN